MSDFPYGTYGENFTIIGLDEDSIYIGDVLQIGEVAVQVPMPRIPYFKLAHKVGDPKMIKEFLHNGRIGFYLRVLSEGFVKAKMSSTLPVVTRKQLLYTLPTSFKS